MNKSLQLFLIYLLIVGIYMIFRTIKKKKISMKYGMYWTIIFAVMLILIIFPNIIERLATLCGFEEAPNMLFLLSIFLLFYIVFRIYVTITKLQETNKTLVQELSILKKEIKK
jgi:hypothetical protein